MDLEEVLVAVRKGKIRQRVLSRESGVTQPSISNLVTGKSATCTHATALALIAAAERLLPAEYHVGDPHHSRSAGSAHQDEIKTKSRKSPKARVAGAAK